MPRSGRVLALTGLVLLGIYLAGFLPSNPEEPHDIALPVTDAPPGGLRIVVFGTSLSARATWPEAVRARLSTCTGLTVTVERIAKPGAGSTWGQSQSAAVLAMRPDLVIMEFAMNDADLIDGLAPGNSRRATRQIVDTLRTDNPDLPILLLTTNPVAGLATLKRPLLPLYYQSYSAVAADAKIGLFDAYDRWLMHNDWQAELPDGVHPDPTAESNLLAAPISAMIATGFGQTCSP
jgi:lysophospholipase L1-like esterase